jgi:hypothetical protein
MTGYRSITSFLLFLVSHLLTLYHDHDKTRHPMIRTTKAKAKGKIEVPTISMVLIADQSCRLMIRYPLCENTQAFPLADSARTSSTASLGSFVSYLDHSSLLVSLWPL